MARCKRRAWSVRNAIGMPKSQRHRWPESRIAPFAVLEKQEPVTPIDLPPVSSAPGRSGEFPFECLAVSRHWEKPLGGSHEPSLPHIVQRACETIRTDQRTHQRSKPDHDHGIISTPEHRHSGRCDALFPRQKSGNISAVPERTAANEMRRASLFWQIGCNSIFNTPVRENGVTHTTDQASLIAAAFAPRFSWRCVPTARLPGLDPCPPKSH